MLKQVQHDFLGFGFDLPFEIYHSTFLILLFPSSQPSAPVGKGSFLIAF
jgi:hypothetical protein